MVRIDIPFALHEKALEKYDFLNDLIMDYENEESKQFEYWLNPSFDAGEINEITEMYPQIRWDCLVNDYDKHSSIEFALTHNLDELEANGELNYYISDNSAIYFNNDFYPIIEKHKKEIEKGFGGYELIELLYKFENGDDIESEVNAYIAKGGSYITD